MLCLPTLGLLHSYLWYFPEAQELRERAGLLHQPTSLLLWGRPEMGGDPAQFPCCAQLSSSG